MRWLLSLCRRAIILHVPVTRHARVHRHMLVRTRDTVHLPGGLEQEEGGKQRGEAAEEGHGETGWTAGLDPGARRPAGCRAVSALMTNKSYGCRDSHASREIRQ